jgi:hypothetical protein
MQDPDFFFKDMTAGQTLFKKRMETNRGWQEKIMGGDEYVQSM